MSTTPGPKSGTGGPRARERTCVGCGLRDEPGAMVRLALAGDEVVFDLAGGAFGRGAHVHARSSCLERAPRGLARAFKRDVRLTAGELGQALILAADRRVAGLLLAARRCGAVAAGADAALEALRCGAPLAVVASDAGAVASSLEVEQASREGRAMAWKTKAELGALLGEDAVAICTVRHDRLAAELKTMRAAVDAGATTTREGTRCSKVPEAR